MKYDYKNKTHLRLREHAIFVHVVSLLADQKTQRAAELLKHADFDHPAFLDFITAGKVRNFVTGSLGAEQVRAVFPSKYADVLIDHWKHENIRKEALWTEQFRLLDLCRSSRLPLMVLKGIVLGNLLYSDVRHRHQSDLDFLIRKSELQRSIELFQDQGFSFARNRQTISIKQLRCEHAITLVRDKFKIDLHWCLRTAPAYTIDEEHVWENQRLIRIEGQNLSATSHEWALTLLLVSFIHDIGRGAGQLKHVIDICLLVRKCSSETDWEQFLQARKRDGTFRTCLNALAFVNELMGPNTLPTSVREAILTHREDLHVAGLGHCLFLMDQPRRSIHNALWFCEVYPMQFTKDAKYTWDRILTHPTRAPLLLSRIIRRTGQAMFYATQKILSPDKPYPVIAHVDETMSEGQNLRAA